MADFEKNYTAMKNKNDLLCHSTPRLDAMVKILRKYNTVADIGCDHAYLAVLLAREGVRVICSDINEGPVERARKNIVRFGLEEKIDLRMGDGLSSLREGEADAIVIAGMGGSVISKILSFGEAAARKAHLVLQPMSADTDLRQFLYENAYTILSETLVREGRRIYTIIEAENGKKHTYTKTELYFSNALSGAHDPLFYEYAQKKLKNIRTIISSLQGCTKNELSEEFILLEREIAKLGGEIK